MSSPAPQSAYVHIPFCRHRCAYCNFTVVANRLDLESDYLDALEIELQWLETPRPVQTLYLGGGTPTELTDDGLDRLLQLLDNWFPRIAETPGAIPDRQATGNRNTPNTPNATDGSKVCGNGPATGRWFEYTVEANPEGLTDARLRRLVDGGVNRLSLGIQSFEDEKLRRLDRQHTSVHAHQAVERALSHFKNVSIDLIFASPGESLTTWQNDLATVIQYAPAHVSTYGLTIEPGTRFYASRRKGHLVEVDEEQQRTQYLLAIERLHAEGFEHYEISNFARRCHEDSQVARSRHNQTYWMGAPYHGAGAGAARYVNGTREMNHRSTTTYIRKVLAGQSPVAESETLDAEARARERLVFGLRQRAGVRCMDFAKTSGYSISDLIGHKLDFWIANQWLEEDDGILRLTEEGLLLSDSLWPEML